MRLFFAINLPDEVVESVRASQDVLRELAGGDAKGGIRWTRPEQFHYTLKFLGETNVPRARQAVDVALSFQGAVEPFTLTIGSLGAFPNPQRPSVLWAGALQGGEELAEFAGRLDAQLVKHAFTRENRPVKAHLTLARIKSYAGEEAAARALRKALADSESSNRPIASFTVDRFALMRSDLGPHGSTYTPVEEFTF